MRGALHPADTGSAASRTDHQLIILLQESVEGRASLPFPHSLIMGYTQATYPMRTDTHGVRGLAQAMVD